MRFIVNLLERADEFYITNGKEAKRILIYAGQLGKIRAMRQEYVFRVLRRDQDNPIVENQIFEFGVSCDDAKAFAEAIIAFGSMLKLQGTPEKTVQFMQRQKDVSALKCVLLGK